MKHLDDLIQQIKERREILKITQESLADLSGVGLRTIKQLEGGKGNILKQFRLLANHAGIPEKQTKNIMALMVSKSDQVKKLIDASFLNDRTKRSYLQMYQLKLKRLGE